MFSNSFATKKKKVVSKLQLVSCFSLLVNWMKINVSVFYCRCRKIFLYYIRSLISRVSSNFRVFIISNISVKRFFLPVRGEKTVKVLLISASLEIDRQQENDKKKILSAVAKFSFSSKVSWWGLILYDVMWVRIVTML